MYTGVHLAGLSSSGDSINILVSLDFRKVYRPTLVTGYLILQSSDFRLAFLFAWPREINPQMPQELSSPNMEQAL